MKKNMFKIGMALFLGVVVFCYIFFSNQSKIVIPCLFHKITGLYCPGCGITRCFNALLHFDFYQAFRYNPLVFILLPFALVYLLITIYSKLRGKRNLLDKKIPSWMWYLLVVVALIFGIIRNIPYFDWLAPTII